jgi:ammonium transporter, Amt family
MVDSGDTAWVLISTALVLFMTPGLALFYGGMVRRQHVLAMLMQNFSAMGLIAVLWALIGFTLAFGSFGDGGFLGSLEFLGLQGVGAEPGLELTIPFILFCAYQMTFAIITPALITGATADRMKYSAYMWFIGLWALLVYSPVAHWVFAGGWLAALGALDFAGGAVVHINAGAGALAAALVLGKRRGWPSRSMLPHSLPLTLLGTGILWFGWFGFNAGSALAANGIAAHALMNTFLAASAGLLAWAGTERVRTGKATTLGGASGAVAGLVAITPCAGFVGGLSGIAIGLVAGIVCCYAVSLKFKLGYDDSLDVVGVHLVGGLVGALLLGLFADSSINELATDGLFYGGGFTLLGAQAIASIVTLVYSLVVSFAILKGIDMLIGARVTEEQEEEGLDTALHAESAYEFDPTSQNDDAGGSVREGAGV